MKETNKDELQSRRQFFKRAAKATLPILGAIALANIPLAANAADVATGCNYGCSGSCENSCKDICMNSCSGGCSRSCVGACHTGCKNTCEGHSSKYY